MPTNERTFQKPFSVATSEDYGEALQQLNAELKNIQKNINYLDTYNITTSVTSEADFPSTQSLLVPGSALVINTPYSFVFNKETYRVGDVVLRLATGEWVHIRAQVGGLYYPKKLTKTNNGYELSYEYLAATPTKESADVSGNEVTTPGKNITFTGLTAPNDNNVYGIFDKMSTSTYSFNHCVLDGKIIKPVIKFFYGSGKDNLEEEVSVDYRLTSGSGKWLVSIDYTFTNLYIMVK